MQREISKFNKIKFFIFYAIIFLGLTSMFDNCAIPYEVKTVGEPSFNYYTDPNAPTCGNASSSSHSTTPNTEDLCQIGIPSEVSQTVDSFQWTCRNLSNSIECSGGMIINGVCGSSGGAYLFSKPSTDLCSLGSPSIVEGSGPFSWTCKGLNGGNTSACMANLVINGTCGSASETPSEVAPSTNLCALGNASVVSGSGPWTWTCAGINGGSQATCSESFKVNGACGSSNGANLTTAPQGSTLCLSGNATSVSGNGPFKWSCNGINTGTTAMCSANLIVNGNCGTITSINLGSNPSVNGLCLSGTSSAISGSGIYNWSCIGQNGGTTASCTSTCNSGNWSNFNPHLNNCNLANTNLQSLSGSPNLTGANLSGAYLKGTIIRQPNLTNANMKNAILGINGQLGGAIWDQPNFSGTDLTGLSLGNSVIGTPTWSSSTICPNGNIGGPCW
jgi:hypothetical protein